jgi:hypothetical protein
MCKKNFEEFCLPSVNNFDKAFWCIPIYGKVSTLFNFSHTYQALTLLKHIHWDEQQAAIVARSFEQH